MCHALRSTIPKLSFHLPHNTAVLLSPFNRGGKEIQGGSLMKQLLRAVSQTPLSDSQSRGGGAGGTRYDQTASEPLQQACQWAQARERSLDRGMVQERTGVK